MSRAGKWERIPIAELIEKGRSTASQDDDTVVWNLNLDQIEPDTGRVLQKVRTPFSELGSSTYPFEANTVLYSKLRPYLNKVVVPDENGWATTELVPLKCKPKVCPHFLAYLLRGRDFLSFANATVAGAKMPRMVMEKFWEYEVPLPPLSEQKRIAAILDSADAIRQKRKAAIAKLDDLAQSVFLEMFGDPVMNHTGWEATTLGEEVEIQSGQVDPTIEPYSEMIHVGGANIAPNTGEFLALKKAKHESVISGKYFFDESFLLYSKIRPNLNKVAKPSFSGICSADIYPIRPLSNLNRDFLAMLLKTKAFLNYAENNSDRANIPKINRTALIAFEFHRPPLEYQNAYANIISLIERMVKLQNDSLIKEEHLFSSLQHRAFAGEL